MGVKKNIQFVLNRKHAVLWNSWTHAAELAWKQTDEHFP